MAREYVAGSNDAKIGMSYNCKICGQPKKGHVCTGLPTD